MKITTLPLVIGFAMMVTTFSCKKSDSSVAPADQTGAIGEKVQEQLRLSAQNIAAKHLPATIASYKYVSAIENDQQLAAVQEKLVADNSMVPQFDGADVAAFSVSTIKERMADYAARSNAEQNVVENIRQVAFPLIQKGQQVLDIVWNAGGKTFHSTCIYTAEGIVYDNMLSNISFIEASAAPLEEIKLFPGAGVEIIGDAARTQAQYSFTATVLDYTIEWVWGSTRGKIIIQHYIIWNGVNYIIDHGGTTDAWMSAGSANARWANNYLSRYSRSKMAWGYGWATPTASFSITFNSSNLTFSTGTSGVGSRGSGSGIHTIYLP